MNAFRWGKTSNSPLLLSGNSIDGQSVSLRMSSGFPSMLIAYTILMQREIHDHYFHKAKREGYRSRAAYKLIDIDEKKSILRKGNHVLDCGCAPGSWLQVAARRVGPGGIVVGIDKKPVAGNFKEENIRLIQGDLTTIAPEELLAYLPSVSHRAPHPGADKKTPDPISLFDVILSDMMPFTTGDRTIDHHKSLRLVNTLLDRCTDLLNPKGNFVAKAFEGEAYPDLLLRMKAMFTRVKGYKPKSSRSESTEMYVIAHGFRGRVELPENEDVQEIELPKRKPSKGWGE